MAWHDGLGRFLMVVAVHGRPDEPSELYLTSAPDGVDWSPRQLLTGCACELTYPSFLRAVGPERTVDDELVVVYVTTPPTAEFRWQDTTLQRMRVTIGSGLVTPPTRWTFDSGADGWTAGGDASFGESPGGELVVSTVGADPYLTSQSLGLSTDEFVTVEVTMASPVAGTAQLWFTTDSAPGVSEERSVSFPVDATETPVPYSIDLASLPGWDGLLDTLRLDPIDREETVRIDSIELLPGR